MNTPGFDDVGMVLSGVAILKDALDTLRRHSLEMAVNQLSRRSVQCDFERVEEVAGQIREAAGRLKNMAAEQNKDLPLASESTERTRGMT